MAYSVAPTPHIYTGNRIDRTMQLVIIALTPAALLGILFFGLPALLVMLAAVISAVVFEAAYQKLTGRPVTIYDCSAAVTGLLLAFTLPPNVPIWLPVVGSFVAIVIAKQMFGGLGYNILNPALAGRAVLTLSFTQHIAMGFNTPGSPRLGWFSPDTITSATPLSQANISPDFQDYIDALLGNIGGAIGETAAIALILGGLFLLAMKVITWHIPGSLLATVYILTLILHPDGPMNAYAFYQLLLGGLLLGAFFMATDYPTSPISAKGKLVFGIGCGIITVLIRLYGVFPEGVVFAILFMNLCVPLIDRYIRPRVFGTKKR